MSLENKIALIAGGTGGLGRAISLTFLRSGAQVSVTFRRKQEFAELHSATGESHSGITGYEADVTNEESVRHTVDSILQKHSRLDILVNAVGGYAGGIKLWEVEPKTFEQMLDLNLQAGFVLARAVIPAMLRQKSGTILNIAAKAAFDHAAGASAYAASKAAAVAVMDSLAEDVRGTGIRVNSVLPSIIDTEANRRAMPQADHSKWPNPADIARVVLFLCDEGSRVIHGAAIPVYGAY